MQATVELRDVLDTDLDYFFRNQLDREASLMAAFTSREPENRQAFDAHWARIRPISTNKICTVVVDGAVAGYITTFIMDGQRDIGYWIGREFWGRGVATTALRQFLQKIDERPLFASAAADNAASIRVLQKCGFEPIGHGRGFSPARNEEIDEEFFRLS